MEKSEQSGEKDWKIGLIVIQCFEKENKDQTKNRGWLQAKGKKGGGKEGLHRLDLPLTDIHSSVLSLTYLTKTLAQASGIPPLSNLYSEKHILGWRAHHPSETHCRTGKVFLRTLGDKIISCLNSIHVFNRVIGVQINMNTKQKV